MCWLRTCIDCTHYADVKQNKRDHCADRFYENLCDLDVIYGVFHAYLGQLYMHNAYTRTLAVCVKPNKNLVMRWVVFGDHMATR